MTIETYEQSYRETPNFFWRNILPTIWMMFKYRRFVLMTATLRGGQFDIAIRYSGLTPAGMKHVMREVFKMDDLGDKAKEILKGEEDGNE